MLFTLLIIAIAVNEINNSRSYAPLYKLTGGLRRRWANKPLNTFPEALEAFRTAMSFRLVQWLNQNCDVFSAYKASLGFVWA